MIQQIVTCDFCGVQSDDVSNHNGNLFCETCFDECFESILVFDTDLFDDIK